MDDQKTKEQNRLVTPGQIIAQRYEVTEHLGTGGFAKVYRAYDQRIERDVAIKFLDLRNMHVSDTAIENILQRFSREAKLAAKIPHRSVVNIYDIGQIQGDPFRPYIVMELLNGADLQDILDDDGPLPPKRLLPLFVDALDGLGQAHDMGIVHKDLKPSNLFLSDPGQRGETLRIVDFGIAHIKNNNPDEDLPAEGRLTATGQILGTLQYMAPEYISTQLVTPALDVYQMGLILIESLSGAPVIQTSNAFECLRIHTFGLLEIPEYLLNSPLAAVLKIALHAEHEQRYADATTFANALSQIDPTTIPSSPLLQGAKTLATAQYQNIVKQTLPPTTGEHRQPSTGQYQQNVAHADTLAASASPQLHEQVTQAELNISAPDTLAQIEPQTQATQAKTLADVDLSTELLPTTATPTKQNKGLKVGLVLLFFSIIIAAGAIVAILNKQTNDKTTDKTTDKVETTLADKTSGKTNPIKDPIVPPSKDPIVKSPLDTNIATNTTNNKVVESPGHDKKKPPKSTKKVKNSISVTVTPEHAKTKIGSKTYTGAFNYVFKGRKKSVRAKVTADGFEGRSIKLSLKTRETTITLKAKPKTDLSNIAALKQLKKEEQARKKKAAAEKARLEKEQKDAQLKAANDLALKQEADRKAEKARLAAIAKKKEEARKKAEAKKKKENTMIIAD